MTQHQFKTWLEGYTEGIGFRLTSEHLNRIVEQASSISNSTYTPASSEDNILLLDNADYKDTSPKAKHVPKAKPLVLNNRRYGTKIIPIINDESDDTILLSDTHNFSTMEDLEKHHANND